MILLRYPDPDGQPGRHPYRTHIQEGSRPVQVELVIWANGPVRSDTIGALIRPGSHRLILRFNPVEGGAVLEAA